jgi:hypothetical protein
MNDYSKMTQQEFDDILDTLAHQKGVGWLLTVPGVWEAVSEELNNDILDYWADRQGQEELED